MNNQILKNPKSGLFIYGILKGVREWQKPNTTFVNYYVGISTGENIDSYGSVSENIEELSINQEQYSQILAQSNLIGQPVKVPFKLSLMKGTTDSGKPWAFLKQYLPSGNFVEPLNNVQPVLDKKSA